MRKPTKLHEQSAEATLCNNNKTTRHGVRLGKTVPLSSAVVISSVREPWNKNLRAGTKWIISSFAPRSALWNSASQLWANEHEKMGCQSANGWKRCFCCLSEHGGHLRNWQEFVRKCWRYRFTIYPNQHFCRCEKNLGVPDGTPARGYTYEKFDKHFRIDGATSLIFMHYWTYKCLPIIWIEADNRPNI